MSHKQHQKARMASSQFLQLNDAYPIANEQAMMHSFTANPTLKRLNNQLRVDFAIDVHGRDGKRKREPTRSVYEEAAVNYEKEERMRRLKKKKASPTKNETRARVVFASNKTDTRRPIRYTEPSSAEISEIDCSYGGENYGDIQHTTTTDHHHQNMLMMHAAASLAQLSQRTGEGATIANENLIAIEKATIEAITKAHIATIAAKDEAIQAANAALAAKEELVKAQAALIAMMKESSAINTRQ